MSPFGNANMKEVLYRPTFRSGNRYVRPKVCCKQRFKFDNLASDALKLPASVPFFLVWLLVSFSSFGRWCPFRNLAVGVIFVVWQLVSFSLCGCWCPLWRFAVGVLLLVWLLASFCSFGNWCPFRGVAGGRSENLRKYGCV